MGQEPDHYAILQVDPRAEREVIEAAYRRLAVKYHPDRDPSPGATDRMKMINAAYEILSDPEKRRSYDLRRGVFSGWRVNVPPRESHQQSPFSRFLPMLLLSLGLTVISQAARFGGPRLVLMVVLLFLLIWGLWMLRKWWKD